jgi:hypothetical protein
VIAAKPVGQQEECAIVLACAAASAVDDEGISVPLHDGPFVGGQQKRGLGAAEAVWSAVQGDAGAARIDDGPIDEVERDVLENPDGAFEISLGAGVCGQIDKRPERIFLALLVVSPLVESFPVERE